MRDLIYLPVIQSNVNFFCFLKRTMRPELSVRGFNFRILGFWFHFISAMSRVTMIADVEVRGTPLNSPTNNVQQDSKSSTGVLSCQEDSCTDPRTMVSAKPAKFLCTVISNCCVNNFKITD